VLGEPFWCLSTVHALTVILTSDNRLINGDLWEAELRVCRRERRQAPEHALQLLPRPARRRHGKHLVCCCCRPRRGRAARRHRRGRGGRGRCRCRCRGGQRRRRRSGRLHLDGLIGCCWLGGPAGCGLGVAQLPFVLGRRRRGRGRDGRRQRREEVRAAGAHLVGEVEDGLGPAHAERGAVVGARGVDGGVVGAEPHAGPPPLGVADLRRELAPGPLPHAAVLAEVVRVQGRRRGLQWQWHGGRRAPGVRGRRRKGDREQQRPPAGVVRVRHRRRVAPEPNHHRLRRPEGRLAGSGIRGVLVRQVDVRNLLCWLLQERRLRGMMIMNGRRSVRRGVRNDGEASLAAEKLLADELQGEVVEFTTEIHGSW
jgi:hypothetical protein